MNKSSHFIGQPVYGHLINLLDKEEILEISRSNGGERYVKHLDAWQHLLMSSWINRLQIIDSTTVTLFSNMLFKGVGRHLKLTTGSSKN